MCIFLKKKTFIKIYSVVEIFGTLDTSGLAPNFSEHLFRSVYYRNLLFEVSGLFRGDFFFARKNDILTIRPV